MLSVLNLVQVEAGREGKGMEGVGNVYLADDGIPASERKRV